MLDEETKKRINKRFYGHKTLKAKYTPKYPDAFEREYKRITNAYMKLLKDELEEYLPTIKAAYRKEVKEDDNYRQYHTDSWTGLMLVLEKTFQTMQTNLQKKTDVFNLRGRLEKLAHLGRKLTVAEWKKVVKTTLGIDIKTDALTGEKMQKVMDTWVQNNVDLIKTIPHDTLGNMKDIIYDGFDKGRISTNIAKDIQAAYGISKRHAKFIARDQVAKLNGEIQMAQQQDAGITHYIWSTSDDERVRDCHIELDGKIIAWNDPPEMWYETKKGRVYTGRYCHPGMDYQCRCVARPVFIQNLNFEMEMEKGNETEQNN